MAIPTPISFWNCDESSGNLIDAVGNNDLTNNNTTTFVTGLIGNAADFESSSSQSFSITDGSQTGLDITGDMTISLWIKPESAPVGAFGAMDFIGKGWDGNTTRQWRFGLQNISSVVNLQFSVSSTGAGGSGSLAVFPSFATGSWFHVVATYTASSGAVVFWVNNSSVAGAPALATSIFNGTGITRLGSENSEYYDGLMDMVGVWNSVLSSGDISDLYNAGAGIQYPFSASGPTNLKSYNTNLKANIKSIDTNVIANVKSLNTNT